MPCLSFLLHNNKEDYIHTIKSHERKDDEKRIMSIVFRFKTMNDSQVSDGMQVEMKIIRE